jgi:thymidine phosphorylase
MSKKIAEGAQTLVLDVKAGNGAFMKTIPEAKELAQKMIAVGKYFKRNVVALITDMDSPLGNCAGNAVEIKQAIEILKGNLKNDLYDLSLELSAQMIFNSKKAADISEAKNIAQNRISSGAALEKFREIIKMQGGNPKVLDNPEDVLPKAKKSVFVKASKSGYIYAMDARSAGTASMLAGAGREKKEDKIDFSAGVIFYKKTGDPVKEGETVAEILYNNGAKIEEAEIVLKGAYIISGRQPAGYNLIKEIIK